MGLYLSKGFRRPKISRWIVLGAATAALLLLPGAFTERFRLASLMSLRPFQWVADRFHNFVDRHLTRRDPALEAQVEYLQQKVEYLLVKNQGLQRLTKGVRELRETSTLFDGDVISAPVVVPSDISLWRKSMTIGRGRADGVERGMVVVWGHHYVGRVAEVGAWSSRVDLFTTPGFKTGAMLASALLEGGGDVRLMGIVEGAGGGEARMKWVLDAKGVEDGGLAVTAGNPLDGTPRGLVLGRVKRAGRRDGAFEAIDILPELSLESLDQVMLLPKPGAP